MSSTYFTIDKTTGSDTTTLKVTTASRNTSKTNYSAKIRVSKGTDVDEASVTQYYRPVMRWLDTEEQEPTVSGIGGTLIFEVTSPYDFWIYQCPSNISGIYVGKEYQAGVQIIECNINASTSAVTERQTIQIAFNRMDGLKSYETSDGNAGFKIHYNQEGSAATRSIIITPDTITAAAAGGVYKAVLQFVGRAGTSDNLTLSHNEAFDYVDITRMNWRIPGSEWADIEFTFKANTGTQELTGQQWTFTTSDGISKSITLNQEAVATERNIIITPASITGTAKGGQYAATLRFIGRTEREQLTISHNESYNYVNLTRMSWRSITSEYADLVFTFQPNTGAQQLTGQSWTFTSSDGISRSITLKQEGNAETVLDVIAFNSIDRDWYVLNNPTIPMKAQEYILYLDNTDGIMGVDCDANYVTILPWETMDNEIHFTVTRNNGTTPRGFTITIFGNNAPDIQFGVNQDCDTEVPVLDIITFSTIDGYQYTIDNPNIPRNPKEYVLSLENNDGIMGIECDADYVTISSWDTMADEIHFLIADNGTYRNRTFTITIFGNNAPDIQFGATQGINSRRITLVPTSINAPKEGGEYNISVDIRYKYLNEVVTVSDIGDVIMSYSDVIFDTETSSTGHMLLGINSNQYNRISNSTVMFTTFDGVSATLPITQEANTEIIGWYINYETSNVTITPEIEQVPDHSSLTLTLTPDDGFEMSLTGGSFYVEVGGDNLTFQSGVLTENLDGTWTLRIEDVYGGVDIIANGRPISTDVPVNYNLDGVTINPMPNKVNRGETFTAMVTVKTGYYLNSAVAEVYLDGGQTTDYTFEYKGGYNYQITVPNVRGSLRLDISATEIIVDKIGMRFNPQVLEFYALEPVHTDISISIVINDTEYIYMMPSGSTSISKTTSNDRFYLGTDFSSALYNKQINSCMISSGDAVLNESMSEELEIRMSGLGNTSYNNIIWDE